MVQHHSIWLSWFGCCLTWSRVLCCVQLHGWSSDAGHTSCNHWWLRLRWSRSLSLEQSAWRTVTIPNFFCFKRNLKHLLLNISFLYTDFATEESLCSCLYDSLNLSGVRHITSRRGHFSGFVVLVCVTCLAHGLRWVSSRFVSDSGQAARCHHVAPAARLVQPVLSIFFIRRFNLLTLSNHDFAGSSNRKRLAP